MLYYICAAFETSLQQTSLLSEMRSVLVYNGKGSGKTSASLLLKCLQRTLKKEVYNISYISAEELIRGKYKE